MEGRMRTQPENSCAFLIVLSTILFCSCDVSAADLEYGDDLTTIARAGPALTVSNVTENEIHVKWSSVSSASVQVTKYQISAYPVKSYGNMNTINRNDWTFYNTTTRTQLMGLHPGTLYNISIWAFTNRGESRPTTQQIWTEIGAPDIPPPVEIVGRKGKTMSVNIPYGFSDNGPITSYQVIVVEKNPIVLFTHDELGDFSQAKDRGIPFYITANLNAEEANRTFHIGDKKVYQGYYNAPLMEDKEYDILVGVVSSLNSITKVSYSQLPPFDESQIMADDDQLVRTSSTLSVVLSAAIGVFGFLLVLSVIVYFLLRKHYNRRRSSDELVLRDHGSPAEENGFLPGALHIDDETDLSEFYDLLKEHYWQIPKSQLEVMPIVLGIGQFGEVREGLVHRRAQTIPCLVQHAQTPGALPEKEKRNLLRELDIMARSGFHPNVVEFFGACDERGILLVSIENHSTSLRGLLLRSRQVTNGTVCSLTESLLFSMSAGIAQGMSHLADRGIFHRHLSTRNILITDGSVPKIANFGLGYYNPLGQKLLYKRWTAPEVMNSNTFNSKSDVWSFGVLLWEIFTLGASPYTHVLSGELLSRIVQGLRLQRPCGVSEDLYQIMLQCWEIDPDERPPFLELCNNMQNMLLNAKEHMNFRDPDFHFMKFDPNAEED